MIRRLVLVVLLLGTATCASAAIYNDVFYDVAEPGWGVFVKQSATFQFLAFFICGPNGQPTWYTAQLTDTGDGTGLSGRFNLTLAQVGDVSATLTFTFVDNTHTGTACTISGSLTHYGGLYTIPNAQYTCSGAGFSPGGIVSASLNLLSQSGQGVEGKWTATTNAGCLQTIRFAEVSN